jgi:hypothetical protein
MEDIIIVPAEKKIRKTRTVNLRRIVLDFMLKNESKNEKELCVKIHLQYPDISEKAIINVIKNTVSTLNKFTPYTWDKESFLLVKS